MIHEFKTAKAVSTPKGGEVKHYYSDDIRIYGNPMDGRGWDIKDKP